eukprot:1553705-Rhodomonas_salina.1
MSNSAHWQTHRNGDCPTVTVTSQRQHHGRLLPVGTWQSLRLRVAGQLGSCHGCPEPEPRRACS